jgi:hypothetical protein
MKTLFFILALALSFAFAKESKYYAACENGIFVVYDENGNRTDAPTTENNIDTQKQSLEQFRHIASNCPSVKVLKKKSTSSNKRNNRK